MRSDQNNPVKRRKSKYGFINSYHFELLNNDICPYCFSIISGNNDEYFPEEEIEIESEEEEINDKQ